MHEFSIASDQETVLAIDVNAGSSVVLKFAIELSVVEPGVRLDLEIRDEAGTLFSHETLGFFEEGFRHSGNYSPGTYAFTARYGESLASEGEFKVEAGTVGETTLAFSLR